ncbi:MAG TPA: MHYT domain-containing protein [Candidatus Acidoferrales bacterium]|nr:MHYT domain-containing protein [Candidatus Acidoferrales bacterium]
MGPEIAGTYDHRLVALSVLIATLASYAALDLSSRVAAARGRVQFAWLFGGAAAMGTGIWSMHYIGMLAFSLPIPVLYDWPTVLLSLLAAVFASAISLFVVSRQRMGLVAALAGSGVMGVGIATMHYTGMEAMRLSAMCHYSPFLVALSVVLAILISLVALWLTFHFRNDVKEKWLQKIASAVLMGAAIPVMHYTGMAAASFTFTGEAPDLSHAVSVSSLGITGITIVTFMVLGLAVLTSLIDRRFSVLESSEERLRLIINTAMDAVITMNAEGLITNWNSEAEKTFGWSSQEALGRRLSELIMPQRYREDHERGLQRFLGTGEGMMLRQRTETTALHRDGHEFPVEVATSPVKFGDQWIFSSFMRDIAEHKRAQEELLNAKQAAEDANRAKSIFLANMSHELRTPLNAIIGYSEMLEEETQELGKVAVVQDLQKIQSAGKHLLALINDILDLSKIEAGKMGLNVETFDVAQVVKEIASTVQPAVTKHTNAIHVDVATNAGEMRADLTKVRQILLNLLSNSCKFTDHGTITLNVSRETIADRDWLQFEVGDSGIGMTAEQKGNLFREFSQADASIARKYGGTGLGLAITHRFVQIMRGTITVDSQPGRGSTFTIQLPADVTLESGESARSQLPVDVAAGSQPVQANSGEILVIDDDPTVRDLMARFLTKLGFHVVTAESGAEALRLAKKVNPLLITLDVMMPEMDGWRVLKQLKADPELAEIPVIMVTVVDNEPMAAALGASSYLIKPVVRDRLAVLVEQYRSARSSRDNAAAPPERAIRN